MSLRFEDSQLIRLASGATRPGFFDAATLERIALAAYVLEPGVISAPWSADLDDLTFASTFVARQTARLETRWDGHAMRAEGTLDLESQDGTLPGVAAIWRGAVIGRGQVGAGRVTQVAGGFVGLAEVDATIDASPAPPPASGPARDAARRTEVARRLAAASERPGAISGDDVATILDGDGAGDIGDFLARGQATRRPGAFRVEFAPGAPALPVPVRLEVAAAIMIFDPALPDFSLAGLLRDTRRAQDLLSGEGTHRAETPGLRRRTQVAAVWVTPAAWFNDADWPGGNPAARLAEASAWLQPHGVALAPRG